MAKFLMNKRNQFSQFNKLDSLKNFNQTRRNLTFLLDTETYLQKRKVLAESDLLPKTREILSSNKINNENFEKHLKNMVFLVDNDEDIDLLIKGLKKNLNRIKINPHEYLDIGFSLVQLLYLINNSQKALQLFNDPEIQFIFFHEKTITTLLFKLNEEKKYNEIINVFEKFRNYSLSENKNKKTSKPLLTIVTQSLLKLNNLKSFGIMKQIVKIENENNSCFSFESIIHVILLSINHNDIFFALEFLADSNKDCEANPELYKNLIAIIFSKLRFLEISFGQIESILKSSDGSYKIFPYTLKCLKEAVSKSKNERNRNRLDLIMKKANSQEVILKKDLLEDFKIKNI